MTACGLDQPPPIDGEAMTSSPLHTLLRRAAGQRMRHSLRRFLKTSSIYDVPVSQCEPGKAKVAVLAPHMDDEVLGCGGTIARHATAGADVVVIFLTDGRLGGPRDMSQEEIVSVRKTEARRAAQILGVRGITFLDAEDSRLRSDPLVARGLREILEREHPEIVYLPFFLEQHTDHRAATAVLLTATRGSALRFECRGYEVGTPLFFPNCLVRIDDTIHLKQQALRCYQSQLAVVDYLHYGMGLSAFRAVGLRNHCGRFAEAFHALELADYRRLYGVVDSRRSFF
jgi:LmbE family N-acetylglucosaminyl deacetylase